MVFSVLFFGRCVPVIGELGLYTAGLENYHFYFCHKICKITGHSRDFKIKWSSKEDFLIDEKTELEMMSLLISYIITS